MTDEIKRAADNLYDRCMFYREKYAKRDIIDSLLAERRKAYEKCARIAESYACDRHEKWECNCGSDAICIANEIRRRMEV